MDKFHLHRILLIVLLLDCGAGLALNGIWMPIQPGRCIDKVSFADPLHGWYLKFNNSVLRTSDGGDTWEPISIPTTDDFSYRYIADICYIAPDTGWLAISGRLRANNEWRFIVMATTDGGANWAESSVQLPGLHRLYGVHFADPLNGWAASAAYNQEEADILLCTCDGGQSWTDITPPGDHGFVAFSQEQPHAKIRVSDNRFGLLGTTGGLMATSDGGNTWSVVQPGHIMDFQVLGGDTVLALVVPPDSIEETVLAISHDGGAQFSETRIDGLRFQRLHFIDSRNGWASTAPTPMQSMRYDNDWGPRLYHTMDGGWSWDLQYAFEQLEWPSSCMLTEYSVWNPIITQITFTSDTTGWVVGDGDLWYSFRPGPEGDFNANGRSDIFDLLELLQQFRHSTYARPNRYDLNHDRSVDIMDILRLLELIRN